MSPLLERYTDGRPDDKNILRNQERYVKVVAEKGDCIVPGNLIVEILSRLPVRTLQQFKTVCKSWYAIIKSSELISKHLQNYYGNDKSWRDRLIMQYSFGEFGYVGHKVYELQMDEKSHQELSYKVMRTPDEDARMCGPCHGLYYLWHETPYDTPYDTSRRGSSLWNPALNEFEYLPAIISKPNIPSNLTSYEVVHGFGFDSTTKDYKIVAVQGYATKDGRNYKLVDDPFLSVFIYSLKSNYWRYWGDLGKCYYLEENEAYTFVNQCYYWLGLRELGSKHYGIIISFDISIEVYKEISLPDCEEKLYHSSQLVVYDESIAFVSIAHSRTQLFIWTWSDEVWTRKLTMRFYFRVWGAFSHCWDNMFVCHQQDTQNLVLCDTDTKKLRVVEPPIEYGEHLVTVGTICLYVINKILRI